MAVILGYGVLLMALSLGVFAPLSSAKRSVPAGEAYYASFQVTLAVGFACVMAAGFLVLMN